MKTFSRKELPEKITHNRMVYEINIGMTHAAQVNNTSLKHISRELKKEGRAAIAVKVLSKNLRGKTDLFGNLYKPSLFIFTTQK